MISKNPFISAKEISEKGSEKSSEKNSGKNFVSKRTIEKDFAKLKRLGFLSREGGCKLWKWIILK